MGRREQENRKRKAAAKSQNRRKTGQIQQPKLLRSAMMVYALLAVNVREVRVL